MEKLISRYSLDKVIISNGILKVIDEGQNTNLIYTDSLINESVNELYHPMAALEKLRSILETKHNSLLNCTGCRIDTSYRFTGGHRTYITLYGQQATKDVNMFEPTEDISKLCTVEEHKVAYKNWLDSLGK